MRFFGGFLLVVAVLFYGTVQYPDLKRIHRLPTAVLQSEFDRIDSEVARHDRDMTTPEGGQEVLVQMRGQSFGCRWSSNGAAISSMSGCRGPV